MTREDAIEVLEKMKYPQKVNKNGFIISNVNIENEALEMAIKALSQEPTVTSTDEPMTMVYPTIVCDDAVSRQDALNCLNGAWGDYSVLNEVYERISKLPSVTQKSGRCKNCKYFEYDSVAKVDGIPLIVAHEICNKWGDGCKTSEDGYCYLFEPQKSEDKE